ncbi:RNA 2',3'-cyclic phosphodiesterase [Defluviimonas sp. WL0050]|uniref:RNA 2',3'-cyclic phosphodiesterase n=1 Tax=Albidovulum litorale TaxID=2984134 RepID=A0ABT2ZNP8_9RHOB|nr:RNA 2',3'-cyclic phosphodiesterase [Defluviimonas sp. WL0050]MCV2872371.1 RNA 2',3'-cyclic phosphodiesterase [Defluviimonas sp. WL0050]
MRAFLAIPLPETTADALSDLQAECPVGRTVPIENLHLTLAFLGDEPEAVIEAAHEAVGTITLPGFELELAGLGTIGGHTPALAYIGTSPCPPLKELHQRIRGRLHGAGLMLPRERFLPHVTLVRFGKNLSATDFARLGNFLAKYGVSRVAPFRVDHFSLFRSTLGKGGPIYDELARYDLG